jgi:hypothetical protein
MKRTSLPLRRREFITLIGGAAVWPLAARAQQPERMRRIGFLTSVSESDAQARLAAFRHGLRDLGWTEGRNIRIDYRFADGYSTRVAQLARELIELQPDVNKPRTLRLDRERVAYVEKNGPLSRPFVSREPDFKRRLSS